VRLKGRSNAETEFNGKLTEASVVPPMLSRRVANPTQLRCEMDNLVEHRCRNRVDVSVEVLGYEDDLV
jgi:hypothetical protein